MKTIRAELSSPYEIKPGSLVLIEPDREWIGWSRHMDVLVGEIVTVTRTERNRIWCNVNLFWFRADHVILLKL